MKWFGGKWFSGKWFSGKWFAGQGAAAATSPTGKYVVSAIQGNLFDVTAAGDRFSVTATYQNNFHVTK